MPIVLSLMLIATAPGGQQPDTVSPWIGMYDGGQTEMAVGLELGVEGRFQYGLSYGALDEQAEGTWRLEQDNILLSSDPVTPPRFEFLGQTQASPGILRVTLATPRGLTPQYLDAAIEFADGRDELVQLNEEPVTLPFESANPPVRATILFRMFNLRSEPVTIEPGRGYALAFRFEPNDLGKADFRGEALAIEGRELLLQRHDRLIRFRRVPSP